MGPRSNERGKIACLLTRPRYRRASMGPRSNERGKLINDPEALAEDYGASMGPRSNERGKENERSVSRIGLSRFNGAAL